MESDAANQMAAALDRLWVRFLPETRSRIEILETAARALANGPLSDSDREAAAGAAHKLAGSLGNFGLQRGTAIARELEVLYAGGAGPAPEDAVRMTSELRQLVDSRIASSPA
jgi:HPt (histidine-containing phosphotransfer) domain-containing protein